MTQELAHSPFGGSSASRWMNCPGSLALSAYVPPKASSSYASEGTDAHTLAEFCLRNNITVARDCLVLPRAVELIREGKLPQLTNDMMDAVQVYLDAVWADAQGAELHIEERFELDVKTADPGEVFGRNDAMVYQRDSKTLICFDYKHGAGVSVAAENNAQALFYATGAMLSHQDWPIEKLVVKIVQPRAFDVATNGAVRVWEVNPLEVWDYLAKVESSIGTAKKARDLIETGEASSNDATWADEYLHAGKWCRFCPAAPVCDVAERRFMKEASLDFKSVAEVDAAVKLPEPKTLSMDQVAAILRGADLLEGWIGMVREYANNQLMSGVHVPGFKLVEKEGRRKWLSDQEEVAAKLMVQFGLGEDEVRPRKLSTITEVERALARKITDKKALKLAKEELSLACTIKESSGLTVVPESDKRPAVNAAERDFASLTFNSGD